MKRSSLWISLVGFVALAAGLLAVNLAVDNTPVLGLDLRGGVSVILQPTEEASGDDLIVVRDLIRDELESRGIAEPDVRIEGSNIVVDLPGVKDQQDALGAVDIAGIVTLRPVIACQAAITTDGAVDPTATVPIGTAPVETQPVETQPVVTEPEASDDESSAGVNIAPVGFASPAATPTTEPVAPATTSPAAPETTVPAPTDSTVPVQTAPPIDTTGQTVLPYPDLGQSCIVGPEGGTGEVFERGSARADIDQRTGGWVANVDLRPNGQIAWNELARVCFAGDATCPTRQLAIVLDDVIQSAPAVQTPDFPGNVQISGDFSEDEVRSLARVLNRGAFPVDVEPQRVETVSATAGNDSLNAALIAGLLGVAVMLLFMIAYYRKLAIVIIGGLLVWGMTVFTLASLVSQATNYALTLAGATGIIVAVGVTVDSYVVFFERLRDEVRRGRSLRNAAPRSFVSTWRTIVAADLVSLIASIILFSLSVGSVKGFALYLGLTTIADLLVCYFFTRPAVFLLSQTSWFDVGPAANPGASLGAAS